MGGVGRVKSRWPCIKARSTPASLPLKGQVTKHTTVKWTFRLLKGYLGLDSHPRWKAKITPRERETGCKTNDGGGEECLLVGAFPFS